MGRTDKSIVLAQIYKDFDDAISVLPTSYTDQQRATQGAALALKARVALIMEDWETAADAAKAVMDLNIYELHPEYLAPHCLAGSEHRIHLHSSGSQEYISAFHSTLLQLRSKYIFQ